MGVEEEIGRSRRVSTGGALQIEITRSDGLREDYSAVGKTKHDCLDIRSKVQSCTQHTLVATSDLRFVSSLAVMISTRLWRSHDGRRDSLAELTLP